MAKNKKDFIRSLLTNNSTYIEYFNMLLNIGLSVYEWENVPPEVDIRYMNLSILKNGFALFFKDDIMGYCCLPCTLKNKLNVYGIPTQREAIGVNGYNKNCDTSNSVIIWHNLQHWEQKTMLYLFAWRLYQIDRTIDVNVYAQKTPKITKCPESLRLTMENLFVKIDGFQPNILVGDSFDLEQLQTVDLTAPYVADKLIDLREKIWSQALTFLGVPNISNEKKERMVLNEINYNVSGNLATVQSNLQSRQLACDEINRLFNLNMSVKINPNITQFLTINTNGGAENANNNTVKDDM